MNTCNSCKSKTSTQRCSAKAMPGFGFCKRHIKTKSPRIWSVVNNVDIHATVIQKLWRGYSLRNFLKLAGPGVLKRSLCHNDEELITAETKDRQDPNDYFSFEENGKLWWFDIKSLYEWSTKNTKLTNPYTKQEIPIETRKRLRELCNLRRIRKLKLVQSETTDNSLDESLRLYWTDISRQLDENHFEDVNPMHFIAFSRNQLWVFTDMLRVDMQVWAAEHNNVYSIRNKFCWLIRQCLKHQMIHVANVNLSSYQLARTLSRILRFCKEPYSVCFMIASALYRL